MAVVDEGSPPPPELKLAWDVERWGALPENGGLFDQDVGLLDKMTVCLNVYKALSRFRSAHGHQIHQLTDGDRKIIGELKKSGVL